MKAITFKTLGLAVLGLAGLAGVASAQSGAYMPTTISSTPTALTAWQIQGEYYGSISGGGGNLGAWVVAKGNNVYDIVILPNGLVSIPGQVGGGWGGSSKYTGSATWNSTTNAYAVTTANGYKTTTITGTGTNRVITGTTPTNVSFTLNRVVRKSPVLGMKPKPEWGTASSWFDSTAAAAAPSSELSKWVANNTTPQVKFGGYLYRGIRTSATHGAGFLHIEVMGAFQPTATGQSRANSGIYLHSKYEMQVLDSFGLTGANNEMGGIYTVSAPLINAALPPMTFQTYDCYFTPRTSGANGDTAGAALMTVYLNGVLVQNNVKVPITTEAGFTGSQLAAGALYLQDHGNEVVYNNVWWIPGATTTSLPYSTVLASVTGINPAHSAKAPGSVSLDEALRAGDVYDLKGRSVREIGAMPVLVAPASK